MTDNTVPTVYYLDDGLSAIVELPSHHADHASPPLTHNAANLYVRINPDGGASLRFGGPYWASESHVRFSLSELRELHRAIGAVLEAYETHEGAGS